MENTMQNTFEKLKLLQVFPASDFRNRKAIISFKDLWYQTSEAIGPFDFMQKLKIAISYYSKSLLFRFFWRASPGGAQGSLLSVLGGTILSANDLLCTKQTSSLLCSLSGPHTSKIKYTLLHSLQILQILTVIKCIYAHKFRLNI